MAPDALHSFCIPEFFSNLYYEIEDVLTVQVCLHHILNKWSILQLACSTEFVPKMHYKSPKHIILLKTIKVPLMTKTNWSGVHIVHTHFLGWA